LVYFIFVRRESCLFWWRVTFSQKVKVWLLFLEELALFVNRFFATGCYCCGRIFFFLLGLFDQKEVLFFRMVEIGLSDQIHIPRPFHFATAAAAVALVLCVWAWGIYTKRIFRE
jgi:hypothetical protein